MSIFFQKHYTKIFPYKTGIPRNVFSKQEVYILIGGILFLFLSFSMQQFTLYSEKNRLQNELEEFIVPDIFFKNTMYKLDNGRIEKKEALSLEDETKILRLAYTSVLDRINPIYSLEGTDVTFFEKGLDSLEKSLFKIVPLFPENQIKETLYPIEFLRELASAELTRKTLSLTLSYEEEEKYLNILLGATEKYEVYTSLLVNTFKDITQKNPNTIYNFIGGTSTPYLYTVGLRKLNLEATQKRLTVQSRIKCLEKNTRICPSLTRTFLEFTNINNVPESNNAISKEIKENKAIIKAYFRLRKINFAPSPIIALNESVCFTEVGVPFYQIREVPVNDNTKYFSPILLNDFYFYNIREHTAEFLSPFKEANIPYLNQTITNLYMCPEIGNDLTKVFTINYIYSILSNQDFLNNIYLNSDTKILAQKIVGGEVIYESDINNYIQGIAVLLKSNKENELAKHLGKELVFSLESLITSYKQQSAQSDRLLGIAVSNNRTIEFLVRGNDKLSYEDLMLSRSYLYVFLFAYNKSFIKDGPLRLLTPSELDLSRFNLVSYNETLKQLYSFEELLDLMYKGGNLYSSIIHSKKEDE